MHRRRFLTTAAAVSGSALQAAVGKTAAKPSRRPIRFYSPASQRAPDGTPLDDPSVVAVRAEPTAENDESARNDAVGYDGFIPLISIDGSVAGIGTMLVPDAGRFDAARNFEYHNADALLAVWDALIDGDTVLWDGTHGQYWDLGKFERFADAAADRGYRIRPAPGIDGPTLAGADAVVITTPPEPFSATELDALAGFAERGGAVMLHDQAGFRGLDETGHLNRIAEALDLAFQFNDDEVTDEEHNAGAPFDLLTTRHEPMFASED